MRNKKQIVTGEIFIGEISLQYVPYQNGVFRKALPDTQGVPSGAILHFLRTLETHQVDIQSLYIFRNGYELVGANRKPYTADTPRRIYSAAKALTGLAVLFAVQEELLSLDTRIAELFPEQVPEVDSEAAFCEGYQALNEYLQAWSCSPHLAGHPYQRDGYYDCQYTLEENPYGIKALSLHWENEKNELQKTNEANDNLPEITLTAENGTACTVRCGLRDEWEENEAFPPMPRENDRLNQIFGITKPVYRVSGGWASDFCFVFQVRASDWMDYYTFYCRFNGDRLSLSIESNMEKLSHIRKRIPMKPREYTDRPIEGIRNLQNV